MEASSVLDLRARNLHCAFTRETLRYSDHDEQGHVNNAVYATLLEAGRVAFLQGEGSPARPEGCIYVMAKLIITYHAELTWPGEVDIATSVLGIGRSSFTIGGGVFKGMQCFATSESVMVLMDRNSRKSEPLPDGIKGWLTNYRHGWGCDPQS
jgi:acyl-CoA thioester hydrolase